MFNPRNYENSRPDGFGALEVAHDDTEHLFVPLQHGSRVAIQVNTELKTILKLDESGTSDPKSEIAGWTLHTSADKVQFKVSDFGSEVQIVLPRG